MYTFKLKTNKNAKLVTWHLLLNNIYLTTNENALLAHSVRQSLF